MEIVVKHIRQGKYSTLSEIFIDGKFFCYGLADSLPLPRGRYRLGWRVYGALHARYKRWFPKMHVGMLHILDAPHSKYAYIVKGRDFADNPDCLLLGMRYKEDKMGDYELRQPCKAYKQLYKYVKGNVSHGTVRLQVVENWILEDRKVNEKQINS